MRDPCRHKDIELEKMRRKYISLGLRQSGTLKRKIRGLSGDSGSA
jgi:hypothetical protein